MRGFLSGCRPGRFDKRGAGSALSSDPSLERGGHTGLLDWRPLDRSSFIPTSLPDMYRLPCTRHRDRIVLLLAVALVIVQLLGMMHAVLHDHARTSAAHAFARVAPELRSTEPSGFGALFSGHDSQADCDLFDHITHADLAGLDAPAFTAAHSDGIVIAGHPGWHIAWQAAGFLARGPPVLV